MMRLLPRATLALILPLLAMAKPLRGQAADPVTVLSNQLVGKHVVVMGFPADPTVTYRFEDNQLEAPKFRLHAFADFVPEKLQMKDGRLSIEGQSRVYMYDSKSGKVGVSATKHPMALIVDFGSSSPDPMLSKLPALLFYPDLNAAVAELPQTIRGHVLQGSGTPGKPAPPRDPRLTFPKFLEGPDPIYTPEATRAGISGACEFELEIDETGKIKAVWLTAPLGYGLDAAGENAVEAYKFAPAKKDGIAVSTSIFVRVGFSLH